MVYALPQWLDHVQYVVVAADGKVRRTVDIPLGQTTMLHDMALTERYAVVFDFPCRLDIEMAMNGSTFPLRWQPGTGCRLGLLPREGEADDVIWVDLPECYSFHPMNSYDDADGNVVIDLVVYDSMFDVFLVGPFEDDLGRLERWTINPTDAPRQHRRDRRHAAGVPPGPQRPHRPAVPLRLRRRRRPVAGRVADVQARPADRRALDVRPRPRPRRRRAGVRRPRRAARPRTTAG